MAFEKLTKGRSGKIEPDSVHVSWNTHFTVSVGGAVAKKIHWTPGMKVDIFIGTDDDIGQMQIVYNPNGQYVIRNPQNSTSEVLQVQRSSLPHVTTSKHSTEAVEFKYLEKGIHITDLPAWATPMRKPASTPAPRSTTPSPPNRTASSAVSSAKAIIKETEEAISRDVIASRTNTNRAPEEFLETTVTRRCHYPRCGATFRTNLVDREVCGVHSD